MTTPEPTTPLEIQLTAELLDVRSQLADQEGARMLCQQQLLSRPTQEAFDQVSGQRNTAVQGLAELEQERARLYSVLQETVAGVQSWVPDLSPVPQPPTTVPPELHAAWIADQIAQRRQEWDAFVHRVVAQASA